MSTTTFQRGIAPVALILALMPTAGLAATVRQAAESQSPDGLLADIAPPPAQPGEDAWTFTADLKAALWSGHGWSPRTAAANEADLRQGVHIASRFPDPGGLLKTANADLSDFLAAGNVSQRGPYAIETEKIDTAAFEAYRIEVAADRCRILAADTEGIRRGMVCVEDMMLRAGGPFLPLGKLQRKPWAKTRISRCFFGPIKRPPGNRDELLDDVDYYPEQYLNRLAHEGINGLWLTIAFKDLCKTSVIPKFGDDADRRLAKLRKTVEKCRRYGIRVYLFSVEPAAWAIDQPALKEHPELAGVGGRAFCPWSAASQRYLYEATRGIFWAVPHLGGLINITHGERLTHCQSTVAATDSVRPACPVCSKKEPWEIMNATLAPMAKGIKDANPQAELIAWFYMPQSADLAPWVYEIPKHPLKDATFQFNFESGVEKEVLEKRRVGGDYWLSTPGPSLRFERMAQSLRQANGSLSAKIQTGCSHEVATVPYVPVPGLLYRKFRAMRALGVTHVMLCWYFGNYPGPMNKAVDELCFDPFPKTEEEFLRRLASLDWGKHADAVVRAWQKFAEGYACFPLTNYFQYYGPMHDGVVWPLLLHPRDAPLAPTWQIASPYTRKPYPPSGDRIGEALAESHTLGEAIALCQTMSDRWDEGVNILRSIEADPAATAQQRRDIGAARALGIQFHSGLDILRFYDLRERMMRQRGRQQLATLQQMRPIVEAELKNDAELIDLCRHDSRLGFHSEAEGYKYFPDKLRWRMNQLRQVLDREMPTLKEDIDRGVDVFAEYTGRNPKGPKAHSIYCANIGQIVNGTSKDLPRDLVWQLCSQPENMKPDGRSIRWTCRHDRNALFLLFDCGTPDAKSVKASEMRITIEPRRMWPVLDFVVKAVDLPRGWPRSEDEVPRAQETQNGRGGWMRIPFVQIGVDPVNPGPLRINVSCRLSDGSERHWIMRKPLEWRLLLGNNNPENLGWLFLDMNRQVSKCCQTETVQQTGGRKGGIKHGINETIAYTDETGKCR